MLADICTPYGILCADNIWIVIFAVVMFIGIAIAFYVTIRDR